MNLREDMVPSLALHHTEGIKQDLGTSGFSAYSKVCPPAYLLATTMR